MEFNTQCDFEEMWESVARGQMKDGVNEHYEMNLSFEVMRNNELIKLIQQNPVFDVQKNDFKPLKTIVVVTMKGLEIKESGGWAKYLETPKNKEGTSLHQWSVTGASIATILGLILLAFSTVQTCTVNNQSNKIDRLLQSEQQLKTDSALAHNKIDSLSRLLRLEKTDSTKK